MHQIGFMGVLELEIVVFCADGPARDGLGEYWRRYDPGNRVAMGRVLATKASVRVAPYLMTFKWLIYDKAIYLYDNMSDAGIPGFALRAHSFLPYLDLTVCRESADLPCGVGLEAQGKD
jgi:hypothetical protein